MPPYQPTAPIPVAVPPRKNGMSTGSILGLVFGGMALLCVLGVVLVAALPGGKKNVASDGTSTPGTTTTTTRAAEPAAANTPSPPSRETFDLPLGQTIIIESDDGTVEVTAKTAANRKTGCSKYGTKPESGNYVVIDVLVEIKAGTGSINPLFFTYVSTSGETQNPLSGAFAGCKNLDSGNDMPAGTKRAGQLVFDVAAGPASLEYTVGLGRPVGSWKIG